MSQVLFVVDGVYFFKKIDLLYGARITQYINKQNVQKEEGDRLRAAIQAGLLLEGCKAMAKTLKAELSEIYFVDSLKGHENRVVLDPITKNPLEVPFHVRTHDYFIELLHFMEPKFSYKAGHLGYSSWVLNDKVVERLTTRKWPKPTLILSQGDLRFNLPEKTTDIHVSVKVSQTCIDVLLNKSDVRHIVLLSCDTDFTPLAFLADSSNIDFYLDIMAPARTPSQPFPKVPKAWFMLFKKRQKEEFEPPHPHYVVDPRFVRNSIWNDHVFTSAINNQKLLSKKDFPEKEKRERLIDLLNEIRPKPTQTQKTEEEELETLLDGGWVPVDDHVFLDWLEVKGFCDNDFMNAEFGEIGEMEEWIDWEE